MENYPKRVVAAVPRPRDYLLVDHGSAYSSTEVRGILEDFGTCLDKAQIEAPKAIGVVQRHHTPFRLAYEQIRAHKNNQTSDQECFQMAVFAVNCTFGLECLCTALLVFGANPRPALTMPVPSQLEQAKVIDCAMEGTAKEQARRKMAHGLKHTKEKKGLETSRKLIHLYAGSLVLVYQTKRKEWEGSFKFMHIDGDTVIVEMNNGRRLF